jgi:integration host factor subunit beta
MATTTKKDLIDRIVTETNLNRTTVKKTIQSFLKVMIQELADGNRLEFRDFGVFEVRERAPRLAQNPRTLQPVPVPAKRTVRFKVGRLMQMTLDGEDLPLKPSLYNVEADVTLADALPQGAAKSATDLSAGLEG